MVYQSIKSKVYLHSNIVQLIENRIAQRLLKYVISKLKVGNINISINHYQYIYSYL